LYFIETLTLVVPRVAAAGIVIVPVTGVVVDAAFVQTVSPESAKSPS
jgi:hypothetical protein